MENCRFVTETSQEEDLNKLMNYAEGQSLRTPHADVAQCQNACFPRSLANRNLD